MAVSRDLVKCATEGILERISRGEFRENNPLPPESELAELLDVSRLTMREAVRVLKDRGVLRVVQGRGTYIRPVSKWRDTATIATVLSRETNPLDLGFQLLEVRRMIEVGASGLAAQRRDEDDLAAMAADLHRYDEADAIGDVESVVDADLDFHQRIQTASDNPFIGAIMMPLESALARSRRATSADARVRRRAQVHHREIYQAILVGDAAAAKDAMRAHMTQTAEDLASLKTQSRQI